LWENIKDIDTDFISFIQSKKDGSIRLLGNVIQVSQIDSHNFIVSKNTIGDTKFIIDKYDADGYFAKECYEKSLNKTYIDKSLSIYNSLR
jgi:signal transduction histidine kinase